MNKTTIPKEEYEEETISLSDFPLNNNPNEEIINNNDTNQDHNHHNRRSTSEPSDFFEFFNHHLNTQNNNISHADDIFFCGKLIPYKLKPNFVSDDHHFNSINLSRRYCDSLPDDDHQTNHTRPTKTSSKLSSRSLDCKRQLRRNSSLVMKSEASDNIKRSLSKGSVKSDHQTLFRGSSKPRWYALMMFGTVKFPPEMDIKDMKSRQVRRSTVMPEGGGRVPVGKRKMWGNDLLRVLSCKSHASTVCVTPIGRLVPHV